MSLCGDCSCLLMSYYSSHNPSNIIVTAIGIFFLQATNFSHWWHWCCFFMVLISLKEYEDLRIDLGLDAHAKLLSQARTSFGGMLLLLPMAILYYLLYSSNFMSHFTLLVSLWFLSFRIFLFVISLHPFSQNWTLATNNISPTPQTVKQKMQKKKKLPHKEWNITATLGKKAQHLKSWTPNPFAIRHHINIKQSSLSIYLFLIVENRAWF